MSRSSAAGVGSARFFVSLLQQLEERSARSLVGIYGPRTDALRRYLLETLGRPAGQEGSFLADPVFEAIVDWKRSAESMQDLADADFLTGSLVEAMASHSGDTRLADYQFPSKRRPFTHQLRAWKLLKREKPQSVLITSGTGSGKTEGFLVPILDDLARERRGTGRLCGVRALFLYPLNALINSQRDRLSAWLRPFGGDIRYCLYKGDTLERLSAADRRAQGRECVSDRQVLREDPPPILVTNATMLEYMLIRTNDRPIFAQSQEALRWIVLDEAHTYLGSRSAELALLLRRVLHAFGVMPGDVRFVATSATIGDASDQSEQQLTQFLADVAGVSEETVHVVRGERHPPRLPDAKVVQCDQVKLAELRDEHPAERGKVLVASAPARRVRDALVESRARTLTELTRIRLGNDGGEPGVGPRLETLEFLDLATSAEMTDGVPFLRVRAHLFHRTQGGMWACLSGSCRGRRGTVLDDLEWTYGKLFFERRERCDECQSLVLEVLLCGECGKEHVAGKLMIDEAGSRVIARQIGDVDVDEQDEFDHLEDEEAESLADEASFTNAFLHRYLVDPATPDVNTIHIDTQTGRIVDEGAAEAQTFGEVAGDSEYVRCSECGTRRSSERIMRPFRAGASLILRSVIPVVLDHAPPLSGGPGPLPSRGRRLLTFTDSRQGTARFALSAQIEAERNYARAFVYHLLVAARTDQERRPETIEKIRREVEALREAARVSDALQPVLQEREAELKSAELPTRGEITWRKAVGKLAHEPEIGWMKDQWGHLPLVSLRPAALAELILLREFSRRPKRQNSLETLGFVQVGYEALPMAVSPPEPWSSRGLPPSEWRNFLKIAIDFGVRGKRAIDVAPDLVPWLGIPHRPVVLVGPDGERSRGVVRWSLSEPRTRRSRLVQLLARLLAVDPSRDPAGEADINACLLAAWATVGQVLSTGAKGHTLALDEQVVLREVQEAWLCPVTRRVLDTVVCGFTPYVVPGLGESELKALPICMPRLPVPFWRSSTDEQCPPEEIEQAIHTDGDIRKLREIGVWQGLSDRIVRGPSYYQVAEHSAQIAANRLQRLEDRFREGRINVLSCSTTMELGVDVGGLSAVAMNNAPPSPANYLQRVGRAGRRGEARAFALTLCNTSPHGEFVFRGPRWPFASSSHVTRVGLGSERIVQRHVNAMALGRFFVSHYANAEVHRLTTRWFFESSEIDASAWRRFQEWLAATARDDRWLQAGLEKLLRRSALEGADVERLLEVVRTEIDRAARSWKSEVEPLTDEMNALEGKREDEPVRRALEIQLRRLREEYLLKELALRNVLPGYGFPTQVVPFVTTTAEDLSRVPRGSDEREDNLRRFRQYPTRDLFQALQEYAPGSNVVVDGRVLRSSGLTLNWKVPASDDSVEEIQALRRAWRCSRCGKIGVSLRNPSFCDSDYCADTETAVQVQEYMEPAGFAVNIRDQATNDLSRFDYIPARQPWIATAGERWQDLPKPELGRFRYSARGHVFAYTSGDQGNGFAVCLRCGLAASESGQGSDHDLPDRLKDHRPMRGGTAAGADKRCRGNDSTFAIRRGQWLGMARETDVFELQLRSVGDRQPPSREASCSIAVALREALAAKIGIEDREIGWAINRVRVAETGEKVWSVLLYDTASGGAGFVAQADQHILELIRLTRRVLECPRECDKACHACLLSYDTHHFAGRLDRSAALEVLSDSFLNGLRLPADV